jgi:hypothetical protein
MSPERRRAAFPTASVLRIALLLTALIAVVVLRSRCGSALGTLFHAIDSAGDGGASHD